MNKLPANLNTTWNLGHTINTNFQTLEQLYKDLKYAFGGLNFIQLYGEIPTLNSYTDTTVKDGVTYQYKCYDIDFASFPSKTPGSAYLASVNIIDKNDELQKGKNYVILMGTFIVSTNEGWKVYNPVRTTHVFQPMSTQTTKAEGDGRYVVTYNYKLYELPSNNNNITSTLTMDFIDNDQIEEYSISSVWHVQKNIKLKRKYPVAGINVSLTDSTGEVNPISHTKIDDDNITVGFWAAIQGNYKVLIKYGYGPRVS